MNIFIENVYLSKTLYLPLVKNINIDKWKVEH